MKKLLLIPLLLILSLVTVNAQLNLTPIGLWRFEDNSSSPTVFDSSTFNNDGELVADAFFDTFVKGTNETGIGSTQYDGADDRVDIIDADKDFVFGDGADDQPFSTGAWINMDDATGFRITAKRASNTQIEWSFFLDASDKLTFSVSDDDNAIRQARRTNAITSLENEWIYVVGTYDGSESSGGITIYIDGVISDVENDNAGAYTAMDDSDSNMTIGVVNTVSSANGHLDEVFVIDQELTEAEVNEAMNNGWLLDVTPPSIQNCQANNTALTCNDFVRISCNVTDFNPFNVTFGLDDSDGDNILNATLDTPDIFIFDKQYTAVTSGSIDIYNFTNATAVDVSGNINITILDVSYNYSCTGADVTPPVITVLIVNDTIIDLRVTNQTVNFTVTDDVGIRNITYFVFNESEELFRNDIFLNASETTFNVIDVIDISGFAPGFYFINRIAYDTSNNSARLLHRIIVLNFDTAVTLLFPTNNSIINFFDNPGEDFEIEFSYTIETTGTCLLFFNDTQEDSQLATIGANSFILDDFNVNETIKYNVGCNFIGVSLNSSFHVFEITVTDVIQFFQAGVCQTGTGAVLMLGLFMLIALILIGMGFATRVGFIGLFGSLLLLFSSIFIATCATAIATILTFLSLLLMIFFVSRGFFSRISGE